MADVYDGSVFGIFEPLRVAKTAERLEVAGGTFRIAVSRKTGQIVSARALGTEFLAKGASMPGQYIGLLPEDEPDATPLGGADRPRFGHELAVEMHPKLFEGGLLTAAHRYDAREAESVKVVAQRKDRVMIRATGRYAGTPVSWRVEYDIDVDGFTKVTVTTSTRRPVLLRWHCFNHVMLASDPVQFIVPWTDSPMGDILRFRYQDTRPVADCAKDELVFGAHVNPFFHLGNRNTGIEFSKQDFDDRWAGFKDTPVRLEDGTRVEIDAVETRDGRVMQAADSRGLRKFLTQVYRRAGGFEVEEFDVRNTTIPLNPGDPREKTFWFQLVPPKRPRSEVNMTRAVWPGPHQMVMARWDGGKREWEPPSDEQLEVWARMGVNLVIGGVNYWSGDYAHPTHPEKVKRLLAKAHSLDMKVIPYVTFSDFNSAAPGYQEHALDWMCDKGIEFRDETTLMCFGAEGWRDFFEKQIETLLSNYDFDGLYIDHWENTRQCSNPRHGCGGYYTRYVTEGYHDIARRARRVVARHTGGKGVMMLNSGQGVFSGVLSMFDLRLMGENFDPRRAPELTLESTYNDKRQGLEALVYPSHFASDQAFLNFVMTFGFPHRLGRTPRDIAEWTDTGADKPWSGYKPYWDAARFFGVDEAVRLTAFETGQAVSLATPGARVTAFVKDGKALLFVGVLPAQKYDPRSDEVARMTAGIEKAVENAGISGGIGSEIARHLRPFTVPRQMRKDPGDRPARNRRISDTLRITDLAALGLSRSARYEVQDLLAHRFIETPGVAEIPLTLETMWPRVLYIAPAAEAPRVAHFTGADGMKVSGKAGVATCALSAVPGSPVALYVQPGDYKVRPSTEGFTARKAANGLVRVEGPLPEDRKVEIRFE